MIKKKYFIFLFYLFFIFSNTGNRFFAKEINNNLSKIKEIRITGNRRYNELVYKNFLNIKICDNFNDIIKNKIIKDLFASDYVNDVKISFKQNILYINLEEKNFIKKITFIGNKKLKEKVIKDNLNLKVKDVFSYNLLNKDIEFIKNFYKSMGFFNVEIDYKIQYFDNNLVEVTFNIKENKKTKIGSIYFLGNSNFKDEVLKEQMYSKENKFYRFMTKATSYNADILEYDSYLLKNFYFSKGYLDFAIISANGKFNKKDNTFDIIFSVEEGEKYYFGNVDVINNTILKKDVKFNKKIQDILKDIKIADVFNINIVNQVIAKINNILIKENFLIVNPQILPNKITKKVNVNFVIDNTEHLYIGKIFIKNNTKTYDSTLREILSIKEGDSFNENNISRSIQKIQNLGFVENTTYSKNEGIFKNQVDITISVKEKNSGNLSFGVGYSSVDKLNGNIGISQRNLFGKAIEFSFDISLNEKYKNFTFSFIKPNFMNTSMISGFNVFFQSNNTRKNIDLNIGYDEFTYGFDTFLKFDLSDYLSETIRYKYSFEKLKNISIDYEGILTTKKQQTSEISFNLAYDKRDNYYDTKSGYILSYTIDYAGLLGTKDYIRNTLYFAFYHPVYTDKLILKFETKLANIFSINNNPLYPNDGFFLGGNSMRGFENAGIGPRVLNSLDYGLGGTKLYYSNMELKFPLFTPSEFNLFGIFFVNAGTVTGVEKNPEVKKELIIDKSSIRSACGFSILWQTPVGNLSFDFSKVLKKEAFDLSRNFAFNIGKSF